MNIKSFNLMEKISISLFIYKKRALHRDISARSLTLRLVNKIELVSKIERSTIHWIINETQENKY